ncbi:MAG: hypothetical protein MMC33_000861 [Icmadophila ericetorum]|nr:hypothetical protein [Icmadophila ericetorum]
MNPSTNTGGSRPQPLHTSKSFSRFEPNRPTTPTRSRAVTVQGAIPEALSPEKADYSPEVDRTPVQPDDIFDKESSDDQSKSAANGLPERLPEGFDDLPIELISLTDRFIASLTNAKIYSTPPSIERLSEIFQDFYLQAESHIFTHIQTLSSRQYRDVSSSLSTSSKLPNNPRSSLKLKSQASRDTIDSPERVAPERQMLTADEITNRKKARKLLEHKRLALEEAVERRVCEGVYDRIWRHRGTLDEIRDEKLRSRTAALALVGIGLKDLGIEFDATNASQSSETALATQIESWIAKARDGILRMNEARSPLAKLRFLASTHQKIVDLLTKLHKSSSSADEILPTLIYTLITSPPERLSVISDLNFVQRFRSASKMNGEAAYCLTNLEAAITFLETVDLASLRADEMLEGPPKSSSRPSTPRTESYNGWPASAPITSSPATTPLTARPSSLSVSSGLRHPLEVRPSPPSSPAHQRRLSSLFQPPANAFGAATDVVRSTADQGFKNISSTLDSSFKLLFGKLNGTPVQIEGSEVRGTIVVPRTLDDARKLVSPKPLVDEDGNFSETSSYTEQHDDGHDNQGVKSDDRLLDLIGGRKMMRDRSVDSVVSTGSSTKRAAHGSESNAIREKSGSPVSALAQSASAPAPIAAVSAVESMRNLGNSLNPLNRLAGINVMRGFGRSAAPMSVDQIKEPSMSEMASPRIQPPNQHFLDVDDGANLRVGDVAELLKDYKRLAGVMKSMGLY